MLYHMWIFADHLNNRPIVKDSFHSKNQRTEGTKYSQSFIPCFLSQKNQFFENKYSTNESQIEQHWYLHSKQNILVSTNYNTDKYKYYVPLRQFLVKCNCLSVNPTSNYATFLQCSFNIHTKLHNNSTFAITNHNLVFAVSLVMCWYQSMQSLHQAR